MEENFEQIEFEQIRSVYKEVHSTGIIKILINTEEKWVDFLIDRVLEKHQIAVSFFLGDPAEKIEYIDMGKDYDTFKYLIFTQQYKDQITLLVVPRTLLMDKKEWEKYGES